MALSASGFPSELRTLLRTAIASLAAFQTWTDTETAGEAEVHIGIGAVPVDDEGPIRPFAVIGKVSGGGTRISEATYDATATVEVLFEADVDEDYADDPESADTEFLNNFGAVRTALLASPQDLRIRGIRFDAPRRSDPSERHTGQTPDEEAGGGDYYQGTMWIELG